MKWEYHALVGNITIEKMNHLGREGWELVTVYPEGEENYPAAYFKRPLNTGFCGGSNDEVLQCRGVAS